jgi:hypothetical protein
LKQSPTKQFLSLQQRNRLGKASFRGIFPQTSFQKRTCFPHFNLHSTPHLMSSFTFCIPIQNCNPPTFAANKGFIREVFRS